MSDDSKPSSVEIDFGGNPGLERFNNVEDFKKFLRSERIIWRPFFKHLQDASGSMGFLHEPLQKMVQRLEDVVNRSETLNESLPIDQLPQLAHEIILAYA